ncbi:kinase-like domain-containing protein [Trametes gibbosa]|nr:kinase-like domain-containing protein [Trametes gibbosa]
MAPLRRIRHLPYQTEGSRATDSGFASTTQSKEPVFTRPTTTSTPQRDSKGTPTNGVATISHTPRRAPPLALHDIEIIRTIGSGGWGSVHTVGVKRRLSHPLERPNAIFALKAMGKHSMRDMERNDRGRTNGNAANRRNAERRYLASLPWNPFIAGLIDAHVDQKNIYLVMEFGPSESLHTQLHRRPRLNEHEVKFYFSNIVLALEFLHTHGVAHCDVKPENLVLGADGYLLLTDFGLAQPIHNNPSWNRVGTLVYMSPELISGEPVDTVEKRVALDWWAAAVSLFEMKALILPFESDSTIELAHKHENAPLQWPEHIAVDEGLQDLLSRMLHFSLPHRVGASEVPEGKNGSLINRELRRHRYLASFNWERIENRVATAPRVAKPAPDEADIRHRARFPEQSQVPGVSLKRPSARLEWLEIKSEKEPSAYKKRRMAGEFSMCLPPRPEPSPSEVVERGSTVVPQS